MNIKSLFAAVVVAFLMTACGGGSSGGNAGSAVPIQCIDSLTFYARINGGNMSGYASGWSDSDRDAVFFYLNNVDPGNC